MEKSLKQAHLALSKAEQEFLTAIDKVEPLEQARKDLQKLLNSQEESEGKLNQSVEA